MENAKNLIRWHGIIAMLDTPDPWQRVIPTEQFTWRTLPLPLRTISHVNNKTGHADAENIGTVEHVHLSGLEVHAAGWADRFSPDGRLIENGEQLGVGVDIEPLTSKLLALTINNAPVWPQCYISKVL